MLSFSISFLYDFLFDLANICNSLNCEIAWNTAHNLHKKSRCRFWISVWYYITIYFVYCGAFSFINRVIFSQGYIDYQENLLHCLDPDKTTITYEPKIHSFFIQTRNWRGIPIKEGGATFSAILSCLLDKSGLLQYFELYFLIIFSGECWNRWSKRWHLSSDLQTH